MEGMSKGVHMSRGCVLTSPPPHMGYNGIRSASGQTDPTGMLSCFTGDCDTYAKDAARDSIDVVPTVVGLFGK